MGTHYAMVGQLPDSIVSERDIESPLLQDATVTANRFQVGGKIVRARESLVSAIRQLFTMDVEVDRIRAHVEDGEVTGVMIKIDGIED